MKGIYKMQDEEMVWYENYKPVKEYLDREFSKKAAPADKEPKTTKLSWLEVMKNSFNEN